MLQVSEVRNTYTVVNVEDDNWKLEAGIMILHMVHAYGAWNLFLL
jgi:hypothetical protein